MLSDARCSREQFVLVEEEGDTVDTNKDDNELMSMTTIEVLNEVWEMGTQIRLTSFPSAGPAAGQVPKLG